jgi:hypothetical protein
MKNQLWIGIVLGLVCVGATGSSRGGEPGWSGTVMARGEQKVAIESTNILYRPYRPFHVYGNTVRRQYYRGRSLPTASDVFRGSAALVNRR